MLILGALLGGLAGLLLAWQIGVFSPDDYQPTFTFYAYLILILGGMTRIWAIPVGAVLFGLLYSGTRFLDFLPLSLFDSGVARLPAPVPRRAAADRCSWRSGPQGLLGNRRELLLETMSVAAARRSSGIEQVLRRRARGRRGVVRRRGGLASPG